ncbi:MAG: undecaprenyl-diphosphate phosphatase [Isosphaeraceae bacterium]
MAMEWLESLVLGAVQGLTEFLPISSDGHLSITQQAFARVTGVSRSGAENLFFDVMLHLGTLAAILVYYRSVGWAGMKGLLGSTDVPGEFRQRAVLRVAFLAALATAPLIPLALFFKKWIDQAFQSTAAAGVGFLITAAVLLLTAQLQKRGETGKGPAEMTWLDALLIGLAQMFAPLPGVSRSGLTIAAALGLGLSRSWAVGFSLLIAIPAILGAAVFEVRKLDPATLTADRIAQTATAAALAGLIGYGAILWLIKIVRSGKIWYFSVYLIVLGLAVLIVSASGSKAPGERLDVRSTQTSDGSLRRGGPGSTAVIDAREESRPLDRADPPGAGSGPRTPGKTNSLGTRAPGLVLARPLAFRP